jgi:hypothetical protein
LQLLPRRGTWCCDCREGRNVARIPARIASRQGQMAMPCLEGIPHRICKQIRRQIVHSLARHSMWDSACPAGSLPTIFRVFGSMMVTDLSHRAGRLSVQRPHNAGVRCAQSQIDADYLSELLPQNRTLSLVLNQAFRGEAVSSFVPPTG